MAERSKGKSSRRSNLAKRFIDLQKIRKGLPIHLTYQRVLAGLGIALVITLLLIQFQFQSIPDYQVGDIADRTIEAPIDFTVIDEDATQAKLEQMLAEVPIIFDFDFKFNNQVIGELRSAFGEARRLIHEERKQLELEPGTPLPLPVREQLKKQLSDVLPRFSQGRVLDVALKHHFSPELETQLIQLLVESMKYPGVILNRDLLLRYQNRAIVLRNNITEQEDLLSDWTAIRDLGQARDMLRQNEYELTVVSGEDKKVMIGFLDNWIVPNVHFNRELTREREQMALAEVDPVLLQVKRGKTIVRAGDEITPTRLDQLEELKKLKRPGRLAGRIAGVFLIVCFFFFAVWQYFSVHRQEDENNVRHYLLLALVMTISLVLAKMVIALADVVAGSLALPALQNPLHFYLFAPVTLGTMLIILLVGVDLS
ncbi:MAG TPA: hypothetical protein VKZ59_02270, partial [Acidobacteriota bacterium]|nr:hypothetical protein [Acidobacteriota bacterium]